MVSTADLLPLPAGLVAVTGDERTGKTTLLRRIGEDLPALAAPATALWLDPWLPDQDDATPEQVWDALRRRCPGWEPGLQQDLAAELDLAAHAGKRLAMLSTGSRRKVGLVGLLSAGCTVTCLDQPYAALDLPSIRAIRDFLQEAAGHPTRTWVVADYVADPALPWKRQVALG